MIGAYAQRPDQREASDGPRAISAGGRAGRIRWRNITDWMGLQCMRKGYVKGAIEAGKGPDEWVVKLADQMKGQREVGVVVVLAGWTKLHVKTVEWEDLR